MLSLLRVAILNFKPGVRGPLGRPTKKCGSQTPRRNIVDFEFDATDLTTSALLICAGAFAAHGAVSHCIACSDDLKESECALKNRKLGAGGKPSTRLPPGPS
eukprot:5853727-Pyramimonas_sp.AAC.1